MSLLFSRASLASLGLALGLSALCLSPSMAQETAPAPAAPADAAAPAAAPVDPNTVIATVNGQPLTEADLVLAEGELSQQFAQLPPEQRRAAALSAAIEIRVMAAKAVTDGLDKDPDFQRRMAFLQQRALHGEMVEKGVVDKVTDAEVRARYDQEIANTPPVNEVHARHILVKTKEEAEAIIKQLDGGADFQKLANEHTSDPSGKSNGGDLGWFGPGQMVPEFDKAAFALDVGKYTEQPVQSQFGWHVIKLEDKRAKQPPAFDDVKDQAKQAVIRDKYFALVKSLRAGAKVEIPDANLKKAVDTLESAK
ncbi:MULTISPECIES: peptidylprolyl isomerase [unclassified Mesorhizobium]|uniref:peptidylprolyl isomerase n=1 Tax=unclassified Mesorhizobium TaxID=325217 RepID=UPI000FD1C3CA|nr:MULTISPECIES: peptidylprolyl isomerase [unclassified Mesorhizobium]RVD52806.1 peptidylprolyl isomerase [Mesorhizobium sp. M8A.F.Ca.ET.023.02.2.1]RWC80941.1 MAG: peptidylprolyl isomerase [Mesorhizobium sp.]RWE45282.1 MAG: peptidylprolyl isomerase [Mesorhizobium sp.]TGT45866.1 peptidylprolyl isomerase [Mesorhizobium sp. M8A.F.Ca.ET.165.01.1.1]